MGEQKRILTANKALLYAMGIFGVQLFIGLVNSFQTEFYNKMYSGFDANIFYASAIIIFLSKLISCIADPLIGALIDKSSLKGGKMRPWVLRSTFPIAVFTTVMFVYIPFENLGGAAGKIALYGYITLTTVLWNISMSFADIPSQGMLSLLSPNAEERNMAAGFSNIGKNVAVALPGVFVTVVILILNAVKGAGNYADKEYYFITALLILVIGVTLYLLMYFGSRETVPSGRSANAVSFREMFTELKDNKMMRIVFLIYILGFARTMNLIVTVQANGALIGRVNLFGMVMDTTADATWLPGLIGMVSFMLGICTIPAVNRRFGEKRTFIAFRVVSFVYTMACCIFYWLLPEGSALRGGNPALYTIALMQFGYGFVIAADTYVPLVMTADIVDYGQWKTGTRREGTDFAILSMAIKLNNALCVAVGLLMVAVSGYTNVVYNAGVIPVRMQNILIFAYFGFSGVTGLISTIPMLFYKIDKTTKTQMRAALAAGSTAAQQ